MNAIVLVGGLGTRLRPLTYDLPKPMLPIVERPMVARIVEWLARFGIERAVFSLGYRPDAFVEAFPQGEWAGVELGYAVEPEPLDTAGAIRFAALGASLDHERVVVVNGDILTDLDLSELISLHEQRGGLGTIALTPVEDPSSFGVVPTDNDGRVTAFIEKPPRDAAPSKNINAGVYVLEPAVLGRIEEGRRVSIEREIFPGLVEDGALFGYVTNDYWIDTGTPAHYLEAQLDILSGARPHIELPGASEGPRGVHRCFDAVVEGDVVGSYLGIGARVEAEARIEHSVLGANAVIAKSATLKGSVLLPGAYVGEGATVTDSIVGPHALIGKRAVLSAAIIGAAGVVEEGEHLDGARASV